MRRLSLTLVLVSALAFTAPAAQAQSAAPVTETANTTPTATTPATTPTTPPATTTAPTGTTATTETAPGASTTTTSTTPATVVPVPSVTLIVGSTGTAGADLEPAPPIWAVLVGVIAFLSLLVLVIAALMRWRAYDPPWLRRARHSCAEASWRVGGTWAEFTDWIRLGR